MTPNQLYAEKPKEIIRDYRQLFMGADGSQGHLEVFGGEAFNDFAFSDMQWAAENLIGPAVGDRTELRVLQHERTDSSYKYYWRLATLWFDAKPVAILQNSGRYGEDHKKCFVTDIAGFEALCRYARLELVTALSEAAPLKQLPTTVNPEAELPELTTFDDHTYGKPYFRY